jgi:hypothetical protein
VSYTVYMNEREQHLLQSLRRPIPASYEMFAMSMLGACISLTLAVLLFVYQLGSECLDPQNIKWLFEGDLATHYLGWLFFRVEPWHFPLGKIERYLAPMGTTIGLTDSNPLLAISFKILAPVLPEPHFQYIGPWLLLCYCLQVLFAYALIGKMTQSVVARILGAGLFLLSPPLLYRTGHDTLCSHWLILASYFCFVIHTSTSSFQRILVAWSSLVVICGFIHPYVAVMVLGIATAFSISRFALGPEREVLRSALFLGWLVVLLLLVWFILGHFTEGGPKAGWGFGHFSTNLNAFFNPMGRSSLLPSLPTGPGQYEGFAYLGLGTMLLVFAAILSVILGGIGACSLRYWLPLFGFLCTCFLLAISNKIRLGNTLVLSIPFPESLTNLLAPFRASGRFIWPVYYAILSVAMYHLLTARKTSLAVIILGFCVAIQVVDLGPRLYTTEYRKSGQIESPLKSPEWSQIATMIDGIVTWPPFRRQTSSLAEDYRFLALYAATNGLSVTTGYSARADVSFEDRYTRELSRHLKEGSLEPTKIYILSSRFLPEQTEISLDGSLTVLDGYWLWSNNKVLRDKLFKLPKVPFPFAKNDLLRFLQEHERSTIALAVRDEASSNLPVNVVALLGKWGSQITDLRLRGSYAAIIHSGGVVAQSLNNEEAVSLKCPLGKVISGLKGIVGEGLIEIHSAGIRVGDRSSIRIGGIEYSPNERGINIVVLNDEGFIVARAVFDTCVGSDGVSEVISSQPPQIE